MRAMRTAREKGIKSLAWFSMFFGSVAGAAASGTWIGATIRWLLDLAPWQWFAPAILLGLLVAVFIDLIIDLIPNWLAVVSAMFIPSVATAAPSKLSGSVAQFSATIMGWAQAHLVEWVGTGSLVGLSIVCTVTAVLMARRVIKKQSAGFGVA